MIPSEEREAFGDFLAYVWRTGTPSPQVGHWQTKTGGRRLIAWSNRPMAGADGELLALVTTGIDLTDRELHREQDRALQGDPEAKLAEVSQLASEQRALRRVATLVAAEVSPERVFTAVSEECARVLQVNSSAVMRYQGDGTATIVGRHNRDNVDVLQVGERLPTQESSAVGRVRATGRAGADRRLGRRARQARSPRRSSASATARRRPRRSSSQGVLWGAVAITSEDPLPADAEQRLGAFCELVSLAVASAQARADLIASRARLVEAGDEQRRRLERNLHDGAQQHLVSVAVKLRVARSQLSAKPEITGRLLDEALHELGNGLEELREIARGLHPAILGEHGLCRALEVLADRLPIEVDSDVLPERLPEPARGDGLLHRLRGAHQRRQARRRGRARASRVRRDGDVLRCEIADDGRGGADQAARERHRRSARPRRGGGRDLHVRSPPGEGTVVTAVLPLA